MDRLVLWDIDGTLVTVAGISRDIFAEAYQVVVGRELEHVPRMAGKTDHDLVTSTLAVHGVAYTDAMVEDFYRALAAATRARRAEMGAVGHALPGAAEAVAALARVPGMVQSVVTGNIRATAYEKLSAFGLAGPIDFESGGYGSDDGARSTLVRLACQRAAHKYGTAFAADRVVVIGDTPHDITGARANGVVAIGVATGGTSAADLAAVGADVVLDSLTDTAAVVRVVLDRVS